MAKPRFESASDTVRLWLCFSKSFDWAEIFAESSACRLAFLVCSSA